MEETIIKVEEVKKEADKLMINKIAKYESQHNILSITVKKLGEFLANAKKTIKERDNSMAELLEQENSHQKINGKMQLRITELEQEVLETQADNKKQANQINDYIKNTDVFAFDEMQFFDISIVEICNKLTQNNKTPVFFIEKKNHELVNKIKNLIPSALFPEHETDLSSPALVTCLGKRLDFAISIDNGVMHMLSLSKVPMIILFGPTDSEKFAPEYKNSIVLDSKKLYNTKNVSSITIKDVLNATKQHLNY